MKILYEQVYVNIIRNINIRRPYFTKQELIIGDSLRVIVIKLISVVGMPCASPGDIPTTAKKRTSFCEADPELQMLQTQDSGSKNFIFGTMRIHGRFSMFIVMLITSFK